MKTYYISPWGLLLMVKRIAEGKSTRSWLPEIIAAIAVIYLSAIIWLFAFDGLFKLVR